MRKLFLISHLKEYFSYKQGSQSDIAVLNLDQGHSVRTGHEGIEYFPLCEVSDKAAFDKEYIDMIAALGEKRNSKYWWASSLSEKNPLLSKLFGRLYRLVSLDRTLHANQDKDFVIVCTDNVLKEQIYRNYENSYDVRYSQRTKFLYTTRRFLSTMLGIIRQFVRACREYQFLISTRSKINISINTNKPYIVFRSWLDHRSYKSGKYEDSYFKELPERIALQNKNVLIFAGILSDYKANLDRIKGDVDLAVIPSNCFLKGLDIVKTLFIALFRHPSVKGVVFFHNCLISHLVYDELKKDRNQTLFFNAVLSYYSCARLAEAVAVERFIYTYENYAWEKMSVLGIRSQKPQAHIIGFQHAFIAKNSFKYFPGKGEDVLAPFPNRIVTMGRRTAEIMQRFGNYPKDIFSVGCALRQGYLAHTEKLERSMNKGIFVPLTITVEDSVKAIRFLNEAELDEDEKVYLRFHPVTPVGEVLKKLDFELPPHFVISENPAMIEEFKRSSVVLYTWTTVCLEALKAGRPVIYLDVNFPYEVDPLFECRSQLIRRCRQAGRLKKEIRFLREMESSVYQRELEISKQYLDDYLVPASEAGYSIFLK